MESSSHAARTPSSRSGRRLGCWLPAMLGVHLILLVSLVVWRNLSDASWFYTVWHSAHPNPLFRWCSRATLVGLRDIVLFFPLGFVVSSCCAAASRTPWRRFLGGLFAGVLISVSIALAVRAGLNGLPLHRPSILAATFLTFATCVGCWAGATWFCSRGFWRWWFGQSLLLLVSASAIAALLYYFGLESEPAAFAAEPVETEDRRRLVRLFEKHDPREIEPGTTDEITLSERDVNQLLTWGLGLGPFEQKAHVEIHEYGIRLSTSSKIPVVERYLNLVATGVAYVDNGRLAIKPQSLEVGSIAVSRVLLLLCGPSIFDRALQNRHARPLLGSLKSVDLANGRATVTYGHVDVSKDLVSKALLALGSPDMEPATAAHVRELVEWAESQSSISFGACLQQAFRQAERRVAQGGDPIFENRATILALGFLLGHNHVKTLVGPELPKPPHVVQQRFRQVTLRGRKDWTRHFTVSAAIEVLSNTATSSMVGLLKEELDADGGSGFSFADLLADSAGTAFGVEATRNRTAALRFQQQLSQGFQLDDYFPPADDLPEGVSDTELYLRFGGVGGEGYQQLVEEINRRVAACRAYSP